MLTTVNFEVHGHTIGELEQRARDTLNELNPGGRKTLATIHATPAATESGSGKVTLWEASVAAEITND